METGEINLFIDHILFKYEREQKILFQAGNMDNHVKLDWTNLQGPFYMLSYNRSSGKITSLTKEVKDLRPDEITVKIPMSLFKYPASMSMLFNKFSGKEKWNIYVADKDVMQRINGRLPEIAIDGQRYIVDLRWKELRNALDSNIRLALKDFQPVEAGLYYEALFDTRTQKIVDPENVEGKTEDIMLLRIPNEMGLDPVGVARESGFKDTELLHLFPMKKELKGELIPIAIFSQKKAQSENMQANHTLRKKQKRNKPCR